MLNAEEIKTVKDTVDLMIQAADNEFPVMASTIVKVGIANWAEIAEMEEQGHLLFVTIDVPSVLKPGQTVKEKAYYTERIIPRLVEEMGAERLL